MFDNIFIITTYQYPHLEHMYSDISYLSSKGKKVLVLNLLNSNYFARSDLQWQNLKRFFSLHLRHTTISPRVRFFLNKIKNCSCNYIQEIKSFGKMKIDSNFEKIIFETASNYLSIWDNSYFIENDRTKILFNILINYFSRYSQFFIDLFEKNNTALIHMFNGRFSYELILKKVFLKKHKVLLYECNEFNHKCIRKFDSVHNLNGFFYETNIIKECINYDLKINFVNQLIDYKRKNKTISKEKFDFIYYTTNLDEYYFTGHTLDQIGFMQKFSSSFPEDANVAIRLHPNTRNKNSFDKFYWKTFSSFLKAKGLTVFSFDDNVDSYSLSEEKTLSFSLGSTIGGELIFLDQNHYFIGGNTPFALDKGVISLDPNEIENSGFPSKKVPNQNKIDKDIIASSLMLCFFIGENFKYNLFRKTQNKLYNYMVSIFPELFNDPLLDIGIKQSNLIEISSLSK